METKYFNLQSLDNDEIEFIALFEELTRLSCECERSDGGTWDGLRFGKDRKVRKRAESWRNRYGGNVDCYIGIDVVASNPKLEKALKNACAIQNTGYNVRYNGKADYRISFPSLHHAIMTLRAWVTDTKDAVKNASESVKTA